MRLYPLTISHVSDSNDDSESHPDKCDSFTVLPSFSNSLWVFCNMSYHQIGPCQKKKGRHKQKKDSRREKTTPWYINKKKVPDVGSKTDCRISK